LRECSIQNKESMNQQGNGRAGQRRRDEVEMENRIR